jgi:hypothetical protein
MMAQNTGVGLTVEEWQEDLAQNPRTWNYADAQQWCLLLRSKIVVHYDIPDSVWIFIVRSESYMCIEK